MLRIKPISILGKAFSASRCEIWQTVKIVLIIWIVLSVILYLAESTAEPTVYDDFVNSLLWTFVKCINDPGEMAPPPPVTLVGKVVANIIGLLGVALFAIPAGIVGSGITAALAEEKKNKEIDNYKEELLKSFKRLVNVSFRDYLNRLPEGHPDKGKHFFFVPRYLPLSKLQMRIGMNAKDAFEVCKKYPEFRITNLAQLQNEEDVLDDRYVIVHQPINRPYGYCIDRKSKITIVSTSSVIETLTGWSAFYLAKMGGFNYISKDIEVDINEIDSFYNVSKEVVVNQETRDELLSNKHVNQDKLKMLDAKLSNRKEFMNDLNNFCQGEDSWVIMLFESTQEKAHHNDFHFTSSKDGGVDSTILKSSKDLYNRFVENFTKMAQDEFGLSTNSEQDHPRYPFTANTLCYRIKDDGFYPNAKFNAFRISISGATVMNKSNINIILYRMAQVINESFGGRGMLPMDAEDLAKQTFGFVESKSEEYIKRASAGQ